MIPVTAFAGSVPHNYETYLGPLFFEPYAVDLAKRIKEPVNTVLELACGTGRVTKHLVPKVAPSGKLYATDLNEDMLRLAKNAVPGNNIEWSVVDAHEIPFEDASFEMVVCQYGVMFFGDKPKAFAEVCRVLKSGGRFLFNTWDEVKHNALSSLTNDVLQETFSDDPPSFLEKGPFSFYRKEEIKQLLQDAGFDRIHIEIVPMVSVSPSADDAVNGILDGTPLSPYLKERSEKAVDVRRRLKKRLEEQYGEKDLSLPMQAIVCEAIKAD
jgi:ubiquinone/menaquinone biosynthesis C-methylase UbiE